MDNEPYGDVVPNRAMICPNINCGFDLHREDANFCILCGTLLYQGCDDCLAVNPKYAKFCNCCGSNIDELRDYSRHYSHNDEAAADE